MRMILVDAENGITKEVDATTLDDYYALIGTDMVEMPMRRIGGVYYNIICDEEGALKDNPRISAIDSYGYPMLVGNLLIAGDVDADGEFVDLTDEQASHIKRYVREVETRMHPEGQLMLVSCEY